MKISGGKICFEMFNSCCGSPIFAVRIRKKNPESLKFGSYTLSNSFLDGNGAGVGRTVHRAEVCWGWTFTAVGCWFGWGDIATSSFLSDCPYYLKIRIQSKSCGCSENCYFLCQRWIPLWQSWRVIFQDFHYRYQRSWFFFDLQFFDLIAVLGVQGRCVN